jgi:DNA-binding response OmpR family regulator
VNILVAEDDRAFSLMLCTILREAGHTVIPAFDSIQAFMFAMRQTIDIVLLDVGMPGGTGIGVLGKLKHSSKTSGIPVIVVTGSTDPAVKTQAMELGAAAFLAKPIDPAGLLDAVREVGKV